MYIVFVCEQKKQYTVPTGSNEKIILYDFSNYTVIGNNVTRCEQSWREIWCFYSDVAKTGALWDVTLQCWVTNPNVLNDCGVFFMVM
jgi:hypothetical protein